MTDQENAPREETGDARRRGRKEAFDMEAWWQDRSLPVKFLLGIGFAIGGVGLLALMGWVVMLLWNWLVPEIFGLKRLDYWKAWGLLVLCWILFKGIRLGSNESSRGADRKRRRELRRYVREQQPSAGDEPARMPEA
jgi:hypothetical protein